MFPSIFSIKVQLSTSASGVVRSTSLPQLIYKHTYPKTRAHTGIQAIKLKLTAQKEARSVCNTRKSCKQNYQEISFFAYFNQTRN